MRRSIANSYPFRIGSSRSRALSCPGAVPTKLERVHIDRKNLARVRWSSLRDLKTILKMAALVGAPGPQANLIDSRTGYNSHPRGCAT